jgi:putative transposase
MTRYIRKNCVFNLAYHIIWSPKYRKSFLLDLDQQFLLDTFNDAAFKVNGIIENIEIMPDHIHIFIKLQQTDVNIAKVVQILKGYSSYTIRNKYSYMKKYKALWSPSYYIESVGNIAENSVKKYIENQKINVKPTYKYKYLLKD